MGFAPGERRSEHLRERLLRVDAARVDVNQCPFARPPSSGPPGRAPRAAGRAGRQHRKRQGQRSSAQPNRGGMDTDQLVSGRMERATNDIPGDARSEQRARSGQHLPRSTPRERQKKNAVRRNTLLDQPGDTTAKSRRLPGSGSGEHQQRTAVVRDRGALLVVQPLQRGRVETIRADVEHMFASYRKNSMPGTADISWCRLVAVRVAVRSDF